MSAAFIYETSKSVEELKATILKDRAALAEMAAEKSPEKMFRKLGQIAETEAELKVYVEVDDLLDRMSRNPEKPSWMEQVLYIQEFALEKALRGADDEWSGRGNEFRRIENDGKMNGLQNVRNWVRHQKKLAEGEK